MGQRTRDQEKSELAAGGALGGAAGLGARRIFSCKFCADPRKKIPGVTRTQAVLGGGCIRFQVGIVLKRFFCHSVFTPVPRCRPARGASVALSPLRCPESSGRDRLYRICCSKSPGDRGLGPRPPRGRTQESAPSVHKKRHRHEPPIKWPPKAIFDTPAKQEGETGKKLRRG